MYEFILLFGSFSSIQLYCCLLSQHLVVMVNMSVHLWQQQVLNAGHSKSPSVYFNTFSIEIFVAQSVKK